MKYSKIRIYISLLCVTAFLLCGCSNVVVLQAKIDSDEIIYYNGEECEGDLYSQEEQESRPSPQTTPATSDTSASTEETELSSETTHNTETTETHTNSTSATVPSETTTPAPQTSHSSSADTETTPPAATDTTTAVETTGAVTSVPDTSGGGAVNMPVNTYNALNYDEVKGIWISYFELYPILTGKTKQQFTDGISAYYDNAVSLGMNTVYVHVRPYGDAVYQSDYYPWSKYCTGYIGQTPDYDPLEIMISEAHKRGLSFQAWINPLRCYQQDDAPQVPDRFLTKQWYNNNYGDYIIKVNSYWYLNPAYDEVISLIANGVSEIVSGYDVDGVHIDDYFYPTTEAWFDSVSYGASTYNSLSRFRLDNCSKMVRAMYNAVKSHNSTALFGISTQGNVENNYGQLYADVEKWCAGDGYCDYMAPQIYYGFENTDQPFSAVVEQWDKMLSGTGKKLIPGLAVYKIGTSDQWAGDGADEWIYDTEIIARQITKSRTANAYGGIILYSYQFVFSPDSSVETAVKSEIEAFRYLLQ